MIEGGEEVAREPTDNRHDDGITHCAVPVIVSARNLEGIRYAHESRTFPDRHKTCTDFAAVDEEHNLPAASSFGRPQASRDSIEANFEALRSTVRGRSCTTVAGTDREATVSDLLLQLPLVARGEHCQPLGRTRCALARGVPVAQISERPYRAVWRRERPPNPVRICDRPGCGADRSRVEGARSALDEFGSWQIAVNGNQECAGTTLRYEVAGVDNHRAGAIATLA